MSTEDSGQPRPETQIVIEGQKTVIVRKSALSTIVAYLFEMILGLAIVAGIGYGWLTFTEGGQEIKGKYQRSVERTEENLDTNVIVIRFLTAYWQRPPASTDEIMEFNMSRIRNPLIIYKYDDGRVVPFFTPNDGFGRPLTYSVDPEKRIITLHSNGILGLFATSTREIPY